MPITLTLNSEQVLLQDSVRRWAETLDPREQEPFNEIWDHFTSMGLLAAGLPEEVGGIGGGVYDIMIIAIELGRALVKAPFTEVSATAAQLLLKLAPEQVQAIAEGNALPILAHDEENSGGDRSWIETTASPAGDAWALNGKKTGLVGCAHATSYIVSATTGHNKVKLFEIAAAGIQINHYTTLDGRCGGELILDNTLATQLADTECHQAALARALDFAMVIESAEMIGTMRKVLDITRDYMLDRKQFGQSISKFQALQHRIADMYIHCEQAYSILVRAVDCLQSAESHERQSAALAARVLVAKAGLYVTGNAIQLHGGIGVTDEHIVGHHFKRAMVFNQRHGGASNALNSYASLSYS